MLRNDDIEATLFKFAIEKKDLELIREAGRLLEDQVEDFVQSFYDWLESQPEFDQYFGNHPHTLERVKAMQRKHWISFLKAEVDKNYFRSRRQIGAVHEHIQLPNDAYFGGMRMASQLLMQKVWELNLGSEKARGMTVALNKLAYLDAYLALDQIGRIQQEKILESSSKAMMEMATPVTPIWEGILLLPLLGIIDSARTQNIMNKTLEKIAETDARVFVMDISGVSTVDTAVANQLIKITKATLLMGCESIISGISPAIARTIVELGVNVGEVKTTSTLRDAFELALKATGNAHYIRQNSEQNRSPDAE